MFRIAAKKKFEKLQSMNHKGKSEVYIVRACVLFSKTMVTNILICLAHSQQYVLHRWWFYFYICGDAHQLFLKAKKFTPTYTFVCYVNICCFLQFSHPPVVFCIYYLWVGLSYQTMNIAFLYLLSLTFKRWFFFCGFQMEK